MHRINTKIAGTFCSASFRSRGPINGVAECLCRLGKIKRPTKEQLAAGFWQLVQDGARDSTLVAPANSIAKGKPSKRKQNVRIQANIRLSVKIRPSRDWPLYKNCTVKKVLSSAHGNSCSP